MTVLIRHSRPALGAEETSAVTRALQSGVVGTGPETAAFEKEFARFTGLRHATACSSGSAALYLALSALELEPGAQILTSSYVCSAVLNEILRIGCIPALCDVDPFTGNPTVETIRKQLSPRVKAIVVPHMFGAGAADIAGIVQLGVPVIEDCAMSVGATVHGKPVGQFGVAATYSFYATKMLTTGHGGMVATGNARVAEKVRDLLDYDNRDRYRMRANLNLSDIASAVGRAQLKKLPGFIRKRRAVAREYHAALGEITGHISGKSYYDAAGSESVFFRYLFLHPRASMVLSRLNRRGIEAKRPVYLPLHHYLKLPSKRFPGTEKLHRQTVSLPIYPGLSGREFLEIVQTLKDSL